MKGGFCSFLNSYIWATQMLPSPMAILVGILFSEQRVPIHMHKVQFDLHIRPSWLHLLHAQFTIKVLLEHFVGCFTSSPLLFGKEKICPKNVKLRYIC